jgi:hypothetical protein
VWNVNLILKNKIFNRISDDFASVGGPEGRTHAGSSFDGGRVSNRVEQHSVSGGSFRFPSSSSVSGGHSSPHQTFS